MYSTCGMKQTGILMFCAMLVIIIIIYELCQLTSVPNDAQWVPFQCVIKLAMWMLSVTALVTLTLAKGLSLPQLEWDKTNLANNS